MVVDGAKHGVHGGKSLPATGLAMSPIPALVKRPRFKTPRAHVCNHAPENTQNRAARCCYATHSLLTSPQRPFSSAYVPYLAPNGAKNTRFKPSHAHVCRHAPENPQNREAVYHYAAHSHLPSHQRPPTAAYAPDQQTSRTIFFVYLREL